MQNFDLQEVNVSEFLDELGMRNMEDATEDEVRFSCPFPGHLSGDENPSAYMNAHSTAWYCHGCKRKGNAITFLSDLYSFSHLVSIGFLKERFSPGFKEPETTLASEVDQHFAQYGKPLIEPLATNYILAKSTLSEFCLNDRACEYLQGRGFRQDTIEEWQLGYDERSDRITIPIFDAVGRLVGYKGRAIEQSNLPKFLVIGGSGYGFPRYHVGRVVYGLNVVPVGAKSLIIVESELDAIAMHQLGWKQTVALGGSTFTKFHREIILSHGDTEGAVFFFDSDKAGYEATMTGHELLGPYMRTYTVPEHDYDAAGLLQKVHERKLTEQAAMHQIRLLLSDAVATLELMIDEQSSV